MIMTMKKIASAALLSILVLIGSAPLAFAQAVQPLQYKALEPLPGLTETGCPSQLIPLLSGLLLLFIVIGGMLAVARFSIGGVIFMTSDVAGNRAKAKSQMWASVWGLLLLISSVLILNTINPNILSFNIGADIAALGGVTSC